MSFATLDVHKSITLDAPVERLWPLISDTSRINRLIGLPPSRQIEAGDEMEQIIHSRYFGIPVVWRESPFQWIFERWFEVERRFDSRFPVERVLTATTLVPQGERTQVDVRVRIVNRNAVGWAGSQLVVARRMLRDMLRVYHLFEETAQVAGHIPPALQQRPKINTGRLEKALHELQMLGVRPELTARLEQHLRNADDGAVLKMRPFELAEAWGVPQLDALKLFLYATRAGLLDLEWDILCPNCRGPSARLGSLSSVSSEAHCPACNIRYGVNFDQAVELRFSVNSAVREANDISYCIGGPANTRHILAQLRIPADGVRELMLQLAPGTYRIRTRQHEAAALLEIDQAGAAAAHILFGQDSVEIDMPTLGAGTSQLRFTNTSGEELLIMIEERAWTRYAASAALVTTLAEFRSLFSSEVLAPGVGLAVRNLTFLFSDLKDSTTIYDSIGDAPAYARVRDHFAAMSTIVARHHGALVKTIGDAVMAVFSAAEDALAAAIAIQHEFTMGEIARGNPALRVKLGLHSGPCIAVNANGLLDYFGSTVNIAARIQNESVGGDIVLSSAVAGDPGVRELLAREGFATEGFTRMLKGVSQEVKLQRLWVMHESLAAE